MKLKKKKRISTSKEDGQLSDSKKKVKKITDITKSPSAELAKAQAPIIIIDVLTDIKELKDSDKIKHKEELKPLPSIVLPTQTVIAKHSRRRSLVLERPSEVTISSRILQTVEFYEKNDYEAHKNQIKLTKTKSADNNFRFKKSSSVTHTIIKSPLEDAQLTSKDKESAIKLTRLKFELQEMVDREDKEVKLLTERISNFLEAKNKKSKRKGI